MKRHIAGTYILFFLVASGCFAGCSNLGAMVEGLDRSTKDFGRMLRWGEFEHTCGRFMAPEAGGACLERAREYRQVSFTDVRSAKKEVDPVAGKATVTWEIEYYILPSNVVKTVEYAQQWENVDIGGRKIWRAVNLPPELK